MNKKFLPFGVLSLHIKVWAFLWVELIFPAGNQRLQPLVPLECAISLISMYYYGTIYPMAYKLWKRHIPSKVKLFIWKAIRGCLSTLTSIHRYQSIPLTMSPCYLIEPETADDHLLLQCPFIHSLWQHLRARCSGISSHFISLST